MMRRAAVPLAAVAALLLVPVTAGARAPRLHLQAASAIVVERGTGEVAYARNPDAERPIASTTKLMTALLTVERLPLGRLVRVAPYHPGPQESLAYLHTGERLTVRDLLRALLLPSANDAAWTLSERAAPSEPAFVALMNATAHRLGLHHSHYENPIGLDQPGGYSSARDLVRLARVFLANPFLAATVDRPSATLTSGSHVRHVVNRNDLVGRYRWVVGVKTGHTLQAGNVLVGAARRGGIEVISAVLGDPTEAARDADTLALLRLGLSSFRKVTPVRRGQPLASVPLAYRGGQRVRLVADRTVNEVVRRGQRARLRIGPLPASVDGPLRAGARVGSARVLVGRRTVASVALVTATPVAAAGFGAHLSSALKGPWGVVLLALVLVGSLQIDRVRRRRRAQRRRRAGARRGGAEAA